MRPAASLFLLLVAGSPPPTAAAAAAQPRVADVVGACRWNDARAACAGTCPRTGRPCLPASCPTPPCCGCPADDTAAAAVAWEGWGTSLAWWATAWGDRDDLADAFFTLADNVTIATPAGEDDLTVPGLGLNLVRYNAGATSHTKAGDASISLSPNVKPSRLVDAFWLTWEGGSPNQTEPAGVWDWNRDAYQVGMLRRATTRGATLAQLFSNSPVWWMCQNHNPSGSLTGLTDNLQTWNHGQHAANLAEIAAHAKRSWNVTFSSVEPFNEPISDWWNARGTQEGCHFGVGTQSDVVRRLRTELDARGLQAVAVAASDENTYTEALSTWRGLTSAARATVTQINVHGYEGTKHNGTARAALQAAAAAAGKRLWNSEYGEGDASGATLATNLHLDMAFLKPSAWTYWQAVDGASWGLLSGDEDATPAPTLGGVNPKYHVLAQYTRHIRPGMRIVPTATVSAEEDDPFVMTAVGKHVLVVVAFAPEGPRTVAVDLGPLLPPCRNTRNAVSVSRWTTEARVGTSHLYRRADATAAAAAMDVKSCTLTAQLGAHVVATFEVRWPTAQARGQ